uniref:Uncharacterized protein n=1 Tax=Chromera velia CCMP2878 TaxID=1169474 RepID=A0A0G4HNP8_9ALVE|eukprot:Cvel_7653.t1-p1 / transcript=Cvel_7653.t1 / gene=Cvel_7653 / organism=Chromera_velia_CCMP2878 / gene_product=hypothetical protein / transcript_product=hypothetical protein / location=Cvel_scaffold405:57730-58434(+) / protein_length=235 / sequence_SO=supercontig / SO=protein_coding / is_pseudo=false
MQVTVGALRQVTFPGVRSPRGRPLCVVLWLPGENPLEVFGTSFGSPYDPRLGQRVSAPVNSRPAVPLKSQLKAPKALGAGLDVLKDALEKKIEDQTEGGGGKRVNQMSMGGEERGLVGGDDAEIDQVLDVAVDGSAFLAHFRKLARSQEMGLENTEESGLAAADAYSYEETRGPLGVIEKHVGSSSWLRPSEPVLFVSVILLETSWGALRGECSGGRGGGERANAESVREESAVE